MKERILLFLQNENKSYAQFAEEIGVQPSGISHILSGRNNPSLDFVIKMLQKYPALSSEWLLFGTGMMYKTVTQPTLFDNIEPERPEEHTFNSQTTSQERENEVLYENLQEKAGAPAAERTLTALTADRKPSRIVIFYNDRTFAEFIPE